MKSKIRFTMYKRFLGEFMQVNINRKTLWQFLKFGLVGCSNSAVTLIVYYFCIWLFGAKFYLWGQTLGYIAGVINSFFWNSRYVFNDSNINKAQAFIKMCLCNVLVYGMQMILLYCFVDIMSASEKIAPVIVILITLPVNFTLNKVFAFR